MRKHELTGTSGDALMLMLIKLVTMVLGLVITRLLSQYLSVYDYGTYSQILLIGSTLSSMTVLGMVDGVNYFYCTVRDENRREAYISTIFALQGIASAVAGSLVMLLSGQLCRYLDNPDIGGLMLFAVLLPFFQNVLYMFQNLLVAVGKARLLAVRNLVVSLLRLAATVLVVLYSRNVATVLLTTVLLDVAQIVFFLWTLRESSCVIRLRRIDLRLSRRILTYCVPMAVFIIVRALNRDIDKYMISLMTDPQTLAVYANASKMLPVDIVMHSFYTVLVPVITRHVVAQEHQQARQLYRVFLELAYVTSTILCGAILAAAPQVMELFYSEKYLSGHGVFCVYILVDLLQFLNVTLILSAAGRSSILMLLGMGTLGVNAVLNVVFFRWMGILGPALATLLTTAGMGIIMLKLSARELRTKISGFFDGKFLLGFAVQSVLGIWLLTRLRHWLEARDVHYFLIILAVCGSYAAGMLLLHGKRLMRDMKWLNSTK